jgi:hypothetical protein
MSRSSSQPFPTLIILIPPKISLFVHCKRGRNDCESVWLRLATPMERNCGLRSQSSKSYTPSVFHSSSFGSQGKKFFCPCHSDFQTPCHSDFQTHTQNVHCERVFPPDSLEGNDSPKRDGSEITPTQQKTFNT